MSLWNVFFVQCVSKQSFLKLNYLLQDLQEKHFEWYLHIFFFACSSFPTSSNQFRVFRLGSIETNLSNRMSTKNYFTFRNVQIGIILVISTFLRDSLLICFTNTFESLAIIFNFLPTVKTDLVELKFHFLDSSAIFWCRNFSKNWQLQNSM